MRRKGTRRVIKKVRRKKTYKRGGQLTVDNITGIMENKGVTLDFLTQEDAIAYSKTSPQALDNVQQFPFRRFHLGEPYNGSITEWCKIFPQARSINLRGRKTLTLADFQTLRAQGNIQAANLSFTNIKDEMLNLLPNLKSLNISHSSLITDMAFVHLNGIHTLNMSFCNQPTITDAAFANLKGIDTLKMIFCNQHTITAAGIRSLGSIREISVIGCSPEVKAAACSIAEQCTK